MVRLSFLVAGTAMVVAVVQSFGCGSVECWETATCSGDMSDAADDTQGGAEASQGGDDAVEDQTIGPSPDSTADRGAEADADANVDAAMAADATPDATIDALDDSILDAAAEQGEEESILDGAIADGPNAADTASDAPPVACTCVPAVPAGWSGPVAVWEESADAAAQACPSTYPTLAFAGSADPSGAAPSCQCTCEGPCTLQVSTYTNNNCGGTHLCATTPVSKSCVPGLGSCMVQTAKITTSVAFTGCEGGLAKSVAPFAWATAAGACVRGGATYVQGPCEAGQVCVDTPPPTFTRGVCVYQPGAVPCPDAGYPVAYAYYADASDSRDCDASTCQCTGPASSSCSSSNVTLSSAADCSGGAALGGSCGSPFPFTSSPYIGATITSSAGACTQAGTAAPVGTVTPTAPTTVCCPN